MPAVRVALAAADIGEFDAVVDFDVPSALRCLDAAILLGNPQAAVAIMVRCPEHYQRVCFHGLFFSEGQNC